MKPQVKKILTELSQQEINLASVKDISKYENELKDILRKINDFQSFKSTASKEILKTIKYINKIKSTAIQIGVSPKDLKGFSSFEDLYWRVNSAAKENNII